MKITGAALAVFCLTMPAIISAANYGSDLNFFERAAEEFTGAVNRAAGGAQAIIAGAGEGVSIAANELQNGVYSLTDSRAITAARNGMNAAGGAAMIVITALSAAATSLVKIKVR